MTSNTAIQAAGSINGNAIISNTTIQAAGAVYGDSFISNTIIQASGAGTFGSLTSNTIIQASAAGTFGSLTSNSSIQAAGDAVVQSLTSNTSVQANGTGTFGSLASNSSIQAAGTATAEALVSNTSIQAAGTATVNALSSNSSIQSAGTATVNGLISNTTIQSTGNATVGNLVTSGTITTTGSGGNIIGVNTLFTVNVVATGQVSAPYFSANTLIANANVGIGTSTVRYPLDVYGNIHIGNTATISGIVFPDGTFQDTAAHNTPSFGPQYTLQFAGASNTFSGDSSNLSWDAANLSLYTSNLTVPGNANVFANLGVGQNIQLSGNLNGSNTSIISGKTGTFLGGPNGFGALYVGLQDYTNYQPNTTAVFVGNAPSSVQVNIHNDNSGSNASADLVITADNGTATDTYIDLGINSSGRLKSTVDSANDGYLLVYGNTATGGGNLVLGTMLNNDILFTQGGNATVNEVARFVYGQGLNIQTNVNSANTLTGSLVTNGGIGIGQDAWIGGLLNVASGATVSGGANITGQSVFTGNVAVPNYVALFQPGAGGDQFGIGVSQTPGFGVANDVLNSRFTGYAPYNLSASEIHFNIPSSQQDAFTILTNGNVQIELDLAVGGSLNVGSAALFTNNITVMDPSTFSSDLAVNGLLQVNTAVFSGNITVANSSTFYSNLSVLGNLTVSNSSSFGSDLSVLGNLTVAQNTTFNANISVLGNLTVSGNLSASYATIGSFDQINSIGFANVQVLQSNGYVSGNTWVLDGNAYTSASTFQAAVDAWPVTQFRTAHYLLQITNTVTNSYQSSQLMLLQDGTDVCFTEYADIYTNGSLGAWSADITGGVVELLFTPNTSQNMVIKVVRTALDL